MVACAVAAAAIAQGCGGAPEAERPRPVFTFDLGARASYQAARRAWERSDASTRAAAAPLLEAHVRRWPRDPTARPAEAMLALLALDRGDLDRAERLARAARAAGPGVVRDDADVVLGAVRLRRGDAAGAMALLRPLDGKIIDAHFRDAFDAELADAAVRTGDAPRALAAMRRWLARTPRAEQAAVRRRIAELIGLMEEEALVASLSEPLPDDEDDVVVGELAVRLARLARERRDALLARFLLDRVPDRLGEDADPLASIAARASGAAVAPETVGLLVSTRRPELTRRGLDAAAGLAHALRERVPGSPDRGEVQAGSRPTLLVRDAQGELASIPDALARLAADGAGVVIAGFDRAEADVVTAYATTIRLPIVLLTPPSTAPGASGRVFVLGEEGARAREALLGALGSRGRTRVAVLSASPEEVGATEAAGGAEVVAVQPCGAALDLARVAGADAVLVDGGPDCARDVAASRAATPRLELAFAYGLDAATEPSASGLLASAGALPVRGDAEGELAAWRAAGRQGPSWWAALGHDAGELASAALARAGGAEVARDAVAVEARRAAIAAALAAVERPLWTTSARGFGGARRLPRQLDVIDAAAPVSGRGR
jgi:hypothetical protein